MTFSSYFLNSIYELSDLLIFLDLDNKKLRSLTVSELYFNASGNNPITFNKDMLSDPNIYHISKNDYNAIVAEYRKYNHIYELNNLDLNNIAYSWAPISKDQGLTINPSYDDIIILK
jgi:hypothetical protein